MQSREAMSELHCEYPVAMLQSFVVTSAANWKLKAMQVRGESNAATCTYAEKSDKKGSGQSNPRSDAEEMRKRLNRLESSILSMMSSDTKKEEGPEPDEAKVTTVAGPQRISNDTRSTAWDAILNEIGGMKEAWSEDNDKIELSACRLASDRPTKAHRPGLLAGLTPPPDRSTIMQSLPTREAADKLLLHFFDSYNPCIPARCEFFCGSCSNGTDVG